MCKVRSFLALLRFVCKTPFSVCKSTLPNIIYQIKISIKFAKNYTWFIFFIMENFTFENKDNFLYIYNFLYRKKLEYIFFDLLFAFKWLIKIDNGLKSKFINPQINFSQLFCLPGVCGGYTFSHLSSYDKKQDIFG